MGILGVAKQLSISCGVYKEMRAAYRALNSSARRHFRAHQLLLGQFVKAGDLAFDVGANIGNRTEILLALGASVVSFEPQPICAREVAALRNSRLTVVQKAVGEAEGRAQLHLKASTGLASLVPNWMGNDELGMLPVEVTTLDKAIQQFGLPVFCKIDVEGFESQVLRGLSHRIHAVSLEYRCDERGIEKVNEWLNILSRLGACSVNLIAQEEADFLSARWLSVPEFLGMFPACVKGMYWGDLFVRVAE